MTTNVKNTYGARVTSVKDFSKSTSMMCKVISVNGKPIKPVTVDIRVSPGRGQDFRNMGLEKHAQLTFKAEGIAAHQPVKPGGEQGDRSLPAKKDRQGNPIPGTETPVHRILSLDIESIIIQMGAVALKPEAETDEAAIAQNRGLNEVVASIAQASVAETAAAVTELEEVTA